MRLFKTFRFAAFAVLLLLSALNISAAVTLVADGSSDTYGLIDGEGFGIENPDCVHGSFGQHVTQTFDSTLNKQVFVFHSHIDADNDRCTNFDRVRMEIKGDTGAPSELQHAQGQTAYYRWKFRLAPDFIGSSSFTHIFQIKAQGGSDEGAPLITITPRSSIVEVIHSGGAGPSEGRLTSANLSGFLGVWVEAFVRYESTDSGDFEISLKRVSDGVTLLSYNGAGLDMWRSGASINRPKWGVYRSKDTTKKDEQVRFADFCVSESSASSCPSGIGGGGGTVPNMGTGTTQAENMNMNLYESNVIASTTVARATSTAIGYVRGNFSGASGTYNVTIRNYDEDDGAATLTFKVNGLTIASRTLNVNNNTFQNWVINNVFIGSGQEVRIEGAQSTGEHARIDWIQISAASGGSTFDGFYRIMARHSGKAAVVQSASTADGANVIQYTYGGSNTNDEWDIIPIGGGFYQINARHSGKAMTVQSASTAEGANVFQWPYGGSATNDEWSIEDVGGGYFRIVNRNSGKALNVEGGSTSNSANITQRTYTGATHQQWQIISVP